MTEEIIDASVRIAFMSTILIFWTYYFAPCRWVKYCDQRVCDCVSVCLSACISQKPHVQILLNFLYVTCGRDSFSLWRQCIIMHYVFPVLWMTSCFHITKQMVQNQRHWVH